MPEHGGINADSGAAGRVGAWIFVVGMIIIIGISLPLTPILWRIALKNLGPRFNAVGYVVFAVAFMAFAVHMVRGRSRFGLSGFLLVGILACVYLCLLNYLCQYPADRLHFAEYGVLAFLLYRAFRFDFVKPKAYMFAFLVAGGIGILDECVQHALPNRIFEVKDIITNAAAAALGLAVVAAVVRPNSCKGEACR